MNSSKNMFILAKLFTFVLPILAKLFTLVPSILAKLFIFLFGNHNKYWGLAHALQELISLQLIF